MTTPTDAQMSAAIAAACKAARTAIEDYSSFYAGMVPDDALQAVVKASFAAGLSVLQQKGHHPND